MKHYTAVESSEDAGVCIGAEVGGAIHHGGRQSQRERSLSDWKKRQQGAGDLLRRWSWEFRANL